MTEGIRLKLQDLEVFVVEPPPPGWGGRYWIFTKVTTSDGITGLGEVYSATVGPQAMRGVIQDVFERHMAGESAENVELMFRRVYSSGFTQRPDLTVMGAFSGLEMACWDILGKARDRPVYALLGGIVNPRVRTYSYLYPGPGQDSERFWHDPFTSAECAAKMVADGFTAIKFDPAGPYTIYGGRQPAMIDIERSAQFCRQIRESVGDRADLLFGTHGQFTAAGAVRLGRRLEEFDPLWFEEPVPPDDIEALATVARSVRIPIAAGERLTTKSEFGGILKQRAAAVLQPALGRAGGIWESRKIAVLAEAFGAQVAPHVYAGPVEWAASLHLAASIPNLLMVETIEKGGEFGLRLIGHTLKWVRGFVEPSTEPGLGIDFDEDLAREHAYIGGRLHLEMQDRHVDETHANPSGKDGSTRAN